MGEARQRGTYDQRALKAKSSIIRGVVTHSAEMTVNGKSTLFSSNRTVENMLYYTLYWNKVIMPRGIIGAKLDIDKDLIDNGVLELIDISSIPPHPSYVDQQKQTMDLIKHELWAFGEIAKTKMQAGKESWTINHPSKNPVFLPEHQIEQNNIRLRITNALPLPSNTGNFSIDDLLNFKERRNSELIALHESMDQLLKKIYEEPIHAIRETELMRFENAIKELDKTLLERFRVIKKSDWEVSLSPDIPTLIEKASLIAGGVSTDVQLNFGFPIASSITTLASMFSLSKTYGFTFNQFAKDDLKLEYISGAKSENIVA